MTNNTTMTINATADFNLDTLMNMLKDTGATVIIINNGNPIELPVIETTATEVITKKREFNYHAFYVRSLNKVLASHDIKVKTGRGCKRGYISKSAFDTLVKEMENKETSLKKVKFLFNALDEAGYPLEGRGLKKAVIFETLGYIKENNLAKEYSAQRYNRTHVQYELDNLVDKLVKIPFTNDFAIKFANCLREGDEVAYTTFELVEEKTA